MHRHAYILGKVREEGFGVCRKGLRRGWKESNTTEREKNIKGGKLKK